MKKVFLVFWMAMMGPVIAMATPPQDMHADYDSNAQILNVQMRHVTIEKLEHFIRTITVTVNHSEPRIFRFTYQKVPSEFEAQIPIVFNPGDAVHLKASCSKGGSAEVDLLIPAISDDDGNSPESLSDEDPHQPGK